MLLRVGFFFSLHRFVVRSPWQERGREEGALSRGPYEGLGNSCNYLGWYGGKISFHGKLLPVEGTSKSYKICLEACSLGTSCRFYLLGLISVAVLAVYTGPVTVPSSTVWSITCFRVFPFATANVN